MVIRRLAPLCLTLFAPSLALAAPGPDDGPPVQRPSKPATQPAPHPEPAADPTPESGEAPEAPDAQTPAESEPATGPAPAEQPVESGDPASADSPNELPSHSGEPASEDQEDLSNLLVSDEPVESGPRVRASDDRTRVDRNERLRNYYAKIYRPADNPSRIYFAARGAYALAGVSQTKGGGRMGFANVELGQTWNYIGYGVGASMFAGGLTYGDEGVENFSPILVGGGPSLGLGRLGLLGRGYIDFRVGYNFFYAPVSTTRPELSDPPNAAPHGPKVQVDVGLLLHDSESRRFRHGLGASIGWQMLVHTFTGEYPRVNSFVVGFGYFFG